MWYLQLELFKPSWQFGQNLIGQFGVMVGTLNKSIRCSSGCMLGFCIQFCHFMHILLISMEGQDDKETIIVGLRREDTLC